MSSNELDLLLRDGGLAKPSSLPSIVALRIEDALHRLPARSALDRRAQRIRRLAVTTAAIAIVGGAVASYVLLSREPQSDVAILPQRNTIEQRPEFIGTPALGSLLEDSDMMKNGPSATDQGITLMVRGVTYDGYEMTIRYSVTSDKEIDGYSMDASLAMDAREIGRVGYSSSDEPGSLTHRYEKFDSEHYEGLMGTWKLAYSDYRPESFLLKLNATSIGGQAGRWSLEIPVSLTPDITVLRPELTKKSEAGTLEISRIVFSPVSMQLNYRFEDGGIAGDYWVGVQVTDDKGYHYGSHISKNAADLGYMDLVPATNEAESLFIRPFYDDPRNNKQVELEDQFHTPLMTQPTVEDPLILPLGEAGELQITEIEYLADKTVVHTKQPNPSGAGFAIQDEMGDLIPILTLGMGGVTEFKPFPPDAEVTFLTRPTFPATYIPGLEARVDLPRR